MPAIFGLPALTLFQSIGLSLVVNWFTLKRFYEEDKEETSRNEKIAKVLVPLVAPLFVLLCGYIVVSLM